MTVLVVALPAALGGVPAGARALMVGVVAGLVALEWGPRMLRGQGPDPWERAWLAVWLVVTALVLAQLAPLPSAFFGWVGAYPDAFRAVTDVPIRRLSPVPQKTVHYWATFSAYWAVAWIVARSGRRDVVRLVSALAALALFEAVYGLYALARGAETILGIWPKEHYRGDATGTFVNRNHFAGLLALCWPLGLAALLRRGGRRRGETSPLRWALALQVSLLIGTAIFASHSRAGLVAAFVGVAVWLWLARGQSGAGAELRVPPWLLPAIPAVAFAGAVWLGSGALVERMVDLARHTDRLVVWVSLLDLPARTWVLGAGAGAFGDVFKTVQPPELRSSYAYAHSDWLEIGVDFGVGGIAVIAAAGWFWWRSVRPASWGALQAGAVGGIAAMALHAVVDFDLRVPGAAVAFWAAVGIAANPRLGVARRRGSRGRPAGRAASA